MNYPFGFEVVPDVYKITETSSGFVLLIELSKNLYLLREIFFRLGEFFHSHAKTQLYSFPNHVGHHI